MHKLINGAAVKNLHRWGLKRLRLFSYAGIDIPKSRMNRFFLLNIWLCINIFMTEKFILKKSKVNITCVPLFVFV